MYRILLNPIREDEKCPKGLPSYTSGSRASAMSSSGSGSCNPESIWTLGLIKYERATLSLSLLFSLSLISFSLSVSLFLSFSVSFSLSLSLSLSLSSFRHLTLSRSLAHSLSLSLSLSCYSSSSLSGLEGGGFRASGEPGAPESESRCGNQ